MPLAGVEVSPEVARIAAIAMHCNPSLMWANCMLVAGKTLISSVSLFMLAPLAFTIPEPKYYHWPDAIPRIPGC